MTFHTENPPKLIRSLAEAARAAPLREKLLLAPSYRVGAEWTDGAARRSPTGVVNLRPVTPKRLLLDFAEAELRRRRLRIPEPEETPALVGKLLAGMRSGTREGYFTRLPASFSLVEMLARALDELESSGLPSLTKSARHFASREKYDELARLFREYKKEREKSGCAARADILDCALTPLRARGEKNIPLLLVPESVQENADADCLAFLAAWPKESVQDLAEDDEAPSANFTCRAADSTANEARQIFRDCFRDNIPLDAVEIIVTDPQTYAPALCEAAMEVFACAAEDAPLTFHAGLPARHSRPARLLAAWLLWLSESLPPSGLARMLRDGLLGEGWRTRAPGITAEALSSRLLQLPVHGDPEEYRAALGHNKDDKEMNAAESWILRRLNEILPLAKGGKELDLNCAPAVLGAAEKLLKTEYRDETKLDAYARIALLGAIDAWRGRCDWPGFQPTTWLESLAATLRVMGLGPRPGMAHVTDIASGGFAGRERTYILGLDEARFPGGSRQDPVLPDKERLRLSRALPLSARARERRETAMRRLLARLRGTVILSHAQHGAEADREQSPSPLFLRFAENSPATEVGETTVLRPAAEAEATTRRDALLHAVLAQTGNKKGPRPDTEDFAPWFPDLAQGGTARAARESDNFTIYDGHVPEAGADYARAPWPVSPTDLETLATNPAEYFYKRVLKITLPDRFEPTPGKWLEGNERGTLLHDLFQDFIGERIEDGEGVTAASMPFHRMRLQEMLESALRRYRRRKPVRDELACARERGEMIEACVIFLNTEIARGAQARPLRLEAALDVDLPLPSGGVLPLKGRIDRIDRLHGDRDGGGLVIWDYKTGRSDKFSKMDPFRQGRHLQPLLYSLMLDHELRARGLPEPVRRFSYFFPMPRDEGLDITYEWSSLVPAGLGILKNLREMLLGGLYPVSPLTGDRMFSDYAALFPDTVSGDSPLLAPWKTLRDPEEKDS